MMIVKILLWVLVIIDTIAMVGVGMYFALMDNVVANVCGLLLILSWVCIMWMLSLVSIKLNNAKL